MKNYLILAAKTNNKIEASLLCKDQTPSVMQTTYDSIVSSATLINGSSLEEGKIYYFEHDENGGTLEQVLRFVGFRMCDLCHKWIAPQDLRDEQYQGNNIRYCDACLENQPKRLKVHSYHSTSDELKFYQLDNETMTDSSFKGWGIEMEADNNRGNMRSRDGYIKCTDAFYRESRSRKKMWRLETDGSLNYGVEFISNCMSTQFLKSYDFSILTDQMKLIGADDTCSTSGFHLHASKLHFGDDKTTQAINALKLYYVMSIYQNDFLKVSGRKANQMSYCQFLEKEKVENFKNRIKSAVASGSDPFNQLPRYHDTCIITSGATIEVRIFKSTSDPIRLKHTLNLMVGIIENIKNVSWEKIYVMKKLFNKVEPETMQYWRKQGCFLNTYASTQKGETY